MNASQLGTQKFATTTPTVPILSVVISVNASQDFTAVAFLMIVMVFDVKIKLNLVNQNTIWFFIVQNKKLVCLNAIQMRFASETLLASTTAHVNLATKEMDANALVDEVLNTCVGD